VSGLWKIRETFRLSRNTMQTNVTFSGVFVTTPNLKIARVLAKAALKSRLVACANLIPQIESHYWWQGKIETSAEVLILFKTTKGRLKALEKLILARHPYDTPEFVVWPITTGNKRYLDWVSDSVKG
jgi:periplasmic divalent cation tolerance protein